MIYPIQITVLQLVCFYYVFTTFTTVGYGMIKSLDLSSLPRGVAVNEQLRAQAISPLLLVGNGCVWKTIGASICLE
jgi:hypothetical protein